MSKYAIDETTLLSKYAIDETTLQGIANAIRSITGKTETIDAAEMATEIENISPIPQEAFSVTGRCEYRFANDGFNWFINRYGSSIHTSDITSCHYMFFNTKAQDFKEIPFEINCKSDTNVAVSYMFMYCEYLEHVPKITGCKPIDTLAMFRGCNRLKEIPEDFEEWFDWSFVESNINSFMARMFTDCWSLRKIPTSIFSHHHMCSSSSSNYLSESFSGCRSLDELTELPIPFTSSFLTSLFASDSFKGCGRLKNLTFALDPSTNAPYVKEWSGQTLCLDVIGVTLSISDFSTRYNTSGITSAKRVTDAATYSALKNDPDWWTIDVAYSRYNHDSAVATINSLPDTSAFLAGDTSRLPNTIKFKGAAGSKTDGGAINTLTEEEIAVATSKGWTVSLV